MRVTAGGKLVVLGEYHVLDPGGEALVAGVEPGVVATLADAEQLRLDCPDVGVRGLVAERDSAGELRWSGAAEAALHEARFARTALEVALAIEGPEGAPVFSPFAIRVESALGAGGSKAGLGGSAAVAVAVAAGALAWRGHDPRVGPGRELALGVALAAHTRAQLGRGSGVDVAAALAGGLARYRNPGLSKRVTGDEGARELARLAVEPWAGLELEPLDWPAGHVFVAGATGQGSSTRALLRRFEALEGERARAYVALRRELGRILREARPADASSLGEAMNEHQRALEAFDRACGGAGILTEATRELVGVAREHGFAAKISGAGGGDSVLALVPAERRAELERAWAGTGYRSSVLAGPSPGLRLEPRGPRLSSPR